MQLAFEDCPSLDAAPVPTYWLAPQEAAPIPYGKHSGTRSIVMPSFIDAPELEIEHIDTHDLTIEQPQPRRARAGFWRTLAHGIATSLTPVPRERHAPLCHVSHPCEAPMDRLIREYPSVSLYALAII